MRVVYSSLMLFVFALAVGCGEKDLNKDLKPIPKDTPMPKGTGAGPGETKNQGPSESAAPAK